MTNPNAFSDAQQEAERDLVEALQRKAEHDARGLVLEAEIASLRQLVDALKAVEDVRRQADVGVGQALIDRKDVEPQTAPSAAAVADGPAGDPGVVNALAPATTNDRVLWVLRERAERDVDIDVVRDVFRQNDWMGDSKTPEAMVYQAAKRLAEKDPNVVRTGRRTWRWTSEPRGLQSWNEKLAGLAVGGVAALTLAAATSSG